MLRAGDTNFKIYCWHKILLLNLASVPVLEVGHNLDDFACGQDKSENKKQNICEAVVHLGGSWVCWQPGRTTVWLQG